MSILIESQIKSLQTERSHLLVKDGEGRMGSHVAGCDPVEEDMQHRRYILDLAQEELKEENKKARKSSWPFTTLICFDTNSINSLAVYNKS
ncbi:hypothetical protein [Pseudobacillus wudalianchiensis]|uniref:Uncharacterized protein n=1 Tax=Pseudobacillus wudalianchiensis TaxID=1743143 RepID=A0A1B9AE13_9BACI|nr:hypothetical protein [Bacillus wudalianchiensis]OCA82086.1 hypothetical protein A8F95_15415 [Bacillus wudalianchiensis]